mgnify:CR=1 FL=1
MAYLAHGPGANQPPPMSRIVDDGAVELEDSTVRDITALSCSGAHIPTGLCALVATGAAANVAIAASGVPSAPAAVYKDAAGKKVASVHSAESSNVIVISFDQHSVFHANWLEQVLCAQTQLKEYATRSCVCPLWKALKTFAEQ